MAGRICFLSETQKSFKINETIEAKSNEREEKSVGSTGWQSTLDLPPSFPSFPYPGPRSALGKQEMINDPGDSIVELWDSNFASGTHHHRHHSLWKRRTEWWFSQGFNTALLRETNDSSALIIRPAKFWRGNYVMRVGKLTGHEMSEALKEWRFPMVSGCFTRDF